MEQKWDKFAIYLKITEDPLIYASNKVEKLKKDPKNILRKNASVYQG